MSAPDARPPREGVWTVHRQDDNGNRFIVQRHLSKDEAEKLVALYEARGHKQLYWAEEEATEP